ncbi:MAG: hypothetical protein A3F70_07355 [Acidobacteria bacterium RIFCSPLOWO2_12_FULL_67_14]|nr:MAG: hypothetical protein A3H29_18860 [Acidobacteria bacterium RIFCSPLOWO2_02_FULL_67_21]OFW36643.1 MAG: hypothetical protein A3F70_07355 [Acidobacteria bacterium RIFCSPLOWO2_12_FULL_67_14]
MARKPHRLEGFIVKKITLVALVSGVGALVLSTAVWAHHGDAGRYNEATIDVTGAVLETQLINPHAILVVEVDTNGKKVRWQAEMNAPGQLIKQGWVNLVKPGTKVTLTGRQLKSGAPYMNLTERARVVLADSGKVVLQSANYEESAPAAR